MVIRGITDIGQVRASNQDSFYISPDETWCVIADGMGGHNGGETASSTTVEAVTAVMEQGGDYPSVMEQAIREANQKVYAMSLKDSSLSGMGTTIVLCCFEKDSTAMIAHVGDSRAYHISGDTITQITSDHSVVQNLVDSGTITKEQARTHPQKNFITRAIGTEKTVQADINAVQLQQDDYIVLCTDGLTSMVEESAILEIIRENTIDCALQKLAALANINGGIDNITIILAHNCKGGQENA